jgi:hypothetical protein
MPIAGDRAAHHPVNPGVSPAFWPVLFDVLSTFAGCHESFSLASLVVSSSRPGVLFRASIRE